MNQCFSFSMVIMISTLGVASTETFNTDCLKSYIAVIICRCMSAEDLEMRNGKFQVLCIFPTRRLSLTCDERLILARVNVCDGRLSLACVNACDLWSEIGASQ
ncbi:hypothetical protein NPIL_525151 [Nephila pilipes]|uniref:Secreted protein n=1 Tax=Nephila pilipes TaxID=299642 RepID=A0A8X6P9P6_NEPPI|nr:hypothetical protein NPIL_525151 [Nephila pilipes]